MDNPNAPNPANISDDDIIDLTDIVEKGTIPNATATGENLLEAQMSDLLGKRGDASALDSDGFDLDSLLNSSGIDLTADTILAGADSATADSSTAQASMPPPALADEALNMPNMDEVDALLRDLEAPEQPAAPTVSSAPPAKGFTGAGPEEVGTDDLDALLASLNPTPPAAINAASQAKSNTEEADIDDLDSLLDSIMNPDPAPAAAKVSTTDPAILTEDLDDLDALLASAKKEAGQSAELMGHDALDALLDAAEQDGAAHASIESKVVAETTEPTDKNFDLDDLPDSAQQSLVAASTEHAEDPLSGLDDLLEETDDNDIVANIQDEFPLEPDLGDPLLVGESTRQIDEIGQAVLQGLSSMAADMAVLQAQVHKVPAHGVTMELVAEIQSKLEQLQSDMQEMAESHANGLAAAEARISALEAELAEQSVDGSQLAQLETRIEAMEIQKEKAAAEVAARVIREEIAALLAEMAQE